MNDFMKYLDELLKYCISEAKKRLLSDKERMWTFCASEYDKLGKKIGNDEELVEAFSLIINEILLEQMHSFLVAMDGGEWISEQYRFDIVDKENGTVINEDKELHDEFFDYLWEVRNGDPYRNL